MVLVSNEWHNNCEDEHKSQAAAAASTTTATTTTTTTTAATSITTRADSASSSISPSSATAATTSSTAAATTTATTTVSAALQQQQASGYTPATTVLSSSLAHTNSNSSQQETIAADNKSLETPAAINNSSNTVKSLLNDNASNEQDRTIINNTISAADNAINNSIIIADNAEIVSLSLTLSDDTASDGNSTIIINDNSNSDDIGLLKKTSKSKEEDFESSILQYNNIKIMAENTKELPLKEDPQNNTPAPPPLPENTTTQSLTINFNSENNNDKDLCNESNSYPNSNTSTLQGPVGNLKTQIKTQQHQQQIPLGGLNVSSTQITPQLLSNAIQSALNATNNATNATVAAAGLQSNFLSQLGIGAGLGLTSATAAGLQKTTAAAAAAKQQQISSFSLLDTTSGVTPSKSDSNLLIDNNSSLVKPQASSTSVPTAALETNGQSKIVLFCEDNSHPFQTRSIILTPNVECMVGRLIAKSKASESNAIFDCKVLSRKHAVIWYSPDGKFWVKDTKSSNGTFINDNKLGDDEAELHFGDIVKFGVDVLENSRKEVHGCIIARVKLYLPDGREAISIDAASHHHHNRSQYSGEGRISYDEMHRLNLYIQETSQREKLLTSKLCSIQNILDATRKNSALCWQSMITEDQLLSRIHSLEKKLSFMEKNVPENVLRNEVLKLLDEKNSYQHTAKEALRKVYQDRCDAMQMLTKMESAYQQSDNECCVLRDQIMNSKQTLQDVNTRLLCLETEYNEYKDDAARQQQEAKEQEEQKLEELSEKLREREKNCEELKKKISELLIKRADDLLDDEQQAIEKLDAAIADMDMGDDDDDDEEDDNDDDDEDDNDDDDDDDVDNAAEGDIDRKNKRNGNKSTEQAKEKDVYDFSPESDKSRNSIKKYSEETADLKIAKNKSKLKKSKAFDLNSKKSTQQPKRVKEATIMKWLQNSDLNKKEGSLDIFKAICNENESQSDSSNEEPNTCPTAAAATTSLSSAKQHYDFTEKCTNFTSKLKNVQKNLKQLEAEIDCETSKCEDVIKNLDDGSTHVKIEEEDEEQEEEEQEHELKLKAGSIKLHIKQETKEIESDSDEPEDDEDTAAADDDGAEGALADEEFIITKRNGKTNSSTATGSKSGRSKRSSSSNNKHKVLSKDNKQYQLLKSSVNMLREAYNEIWDSVKEQEELQQQQQQQHNNSNKSLKTISSPAVCSQNIFSLSTGGQHKNANGDIESDTNSEVESLSLKSSNSASVKTIETKSKAANTNAKDEKETQDDTIKLNEELLEYKTQLAELNAKLVRSELEAHQTLEIMQIECDEVKQKMHDLNLLTQALREDKKALEQVINENKNNKQKLAEAAEDNSNSSSSKSKEQQQHSAANDIYNEIEKDIQEENDLNAINISALEREEELITYKERLDQQQRENLQLRNEIAKLNKTTGVGCHLVAGSIDAVAGSNVLLKRFLPCGFVVIAIIVYFIHNYF